MGIFGVRGTGAPLGARRRSVPFRGEAGAFPEGHGNASLLLHPIYSAVPAGCQQMVTKLTGCKQLRRARQGIRYCLRAFSFGNKRCLPAKKVYCWTSTAPPLFRLPFKSSPTQLTSPSSEASGLPPRNFFRSERGKWIFSCDSPPRS